MCSLNNAKVGETVLVSKVLGDSKLSRRMMELGITKGVKILVKNFAPLGDPIEIKFRGYCLSIRKNEAKNILIN